MARILYFSDIHLEFRARQSAIWSGWTDLYPLRLGPDVTEWIGAIDLAVLAGDVGVCDSASDLCVLRYAEQLSAFLEAPVVFVPGNHSYYGTEFPAARQQFLGSNRNGVTVLDRGLASFDSSDGPVRVLGATLWTDYELLGHKEEAMKRAQYSISDHRLITMPGGRPFLPADAADEHRLSRAWLAEKLQEPATGKTIVVTHHVPHPSVGNPRFTATDPLAPAFQSDCGDLLEAAEAANVSAWIFGHHHACVDAKVLGVRLLSAQWGYPREETGWKGPGTLEI